MFRVGGLVVELQYATGAKKGQPVTDYHTSSVVNSSGVINNSDLTFIIGKQRVIPNNYTLPDEFYGLVEVTVRFTDMRSGVTTPDDSFFILVSGHYSGGGNNSTSAFDYADPVHMATGNSAASQATANCIYTVRANTPNDQNQSANDFMTGLQSGVVNKLRIIILSGSFDMSAAALNVTDAGNGESVLCMIVAAYDDIILGRKGTGTTGTTIEVRGNRAALAAYYFGTWPFAGLTRSPSSLGDTKPFSINSGGAAATNFPVSYNNKMIVDGNSEKVNGIPVGGLYNVLLDKRYYGPEPVNPGDPPRKIGVNVSYPHLLH